LTVFRSGIVEVFSFFRMLKFPLHILGASSEQYSELLSPYDKTPLAKIEKADANALEKALQNATDTFSLMKKMPAHERARILRAVATQIIQNHSELSLTVAQEGGKPLKDAKIEVTRAANTLEECAAEALRIAGSEVSMERSPAGEGHRAFTIRQAVGPVLAISAFNHPLNLLCHQVGPAIAAGCSIIIKPASQTPLSCLKLADFFENAGISKGVINVATASGKDIEVVVKDPRIRFITFIGGEEVGFDIVKKVAPGVRVSLEHGGVGTAIIEETANLPKAIAGLVKGAFYHAGQVCVSTQIIFVHQNRVEELVNLFVPTVEKLVTGDPTDEKTDVGPLMNEREVIRMEEWTQNALENGAKLLTGGKRISASCFLPTVLLSGNKEMILMNKEVFGPVVVIQPFSDVSALVENLNTRRYSFQTSFYSQDISQCLWAMEEIDSKTVLINETTAFRVDWMPFAGAKQSGMGTGGPKYAIADMTEEKLIIFKK